jgi:hypothetical protein
MMDDRKDKPLTTRDMAAPADSRTGTDQYAEDPSRREGGDDSRRKESQDDKPTPLFDEAESAKVRKQWQDIQASFVDEPRSAVKSADQLVAELMQRLAKMFSDERQQLEHQWDRDGNVSTEDLRVAFQRYRSFFDRLLSI